MFKKTTRFTKGAAILASVFALTVAGTASAGNSKGGTTSTSTISLATPATAAATTAGWPKFGDLVRFNVATTATTSPFVNLNCYQGGTLVAQGWAGYFNGALGTGDFGLYSPMWTGGAANCTASLDMFTSKGWKVLATTSFDVSA
jgi:hypothetical protein